MKREGLPAVKLGTKATTYLAFTGRLAEEVRDTTPDPHRLLRVEEIVRRRHDALEVLGIGEYLGDLVIRLRLQRHNTAIRRLGIEDREIHFGELRVCRWGVVELA